MQLFNGDCLEVLRTLPSDSVDSVVTDPPAGIDYLHAAWDTDKGGDWTSWLTAVMKECLRVLKPGGHALVWSLPRVSHKTGVAMENAGFELRDVITHHYGTGFPKGNDISKQIDKELGAEREVVGSYAVPDQKGGKRAARAAVESALGVTIDKFARVEHDITIPATDEAKKWDGWNTNLKPSTEFWWLCRKPASEKTIAANTLKHGVGGINIDGCRIGNDVISTHGSVGDKWARLKGGDSPTIGEYRTHVGRYPTNLMLSHSPGCEVVGTATTGSGEPKLSSNVSTENFKMKEIFKINPNNNGVRSFGEETVETWKCVDGCPVKELNTQSGSCKTGDIKPGTLQGFGGGKNTFGEGRVARSFKSDAAIGASRFFWCAKPTKSDRNRGTVNTHPTVKSTPLMRYLVRMVTPPGGVVLDPFGGSGSTAVAAKEEGVDCILIELMPEYLEIAKARLNEGTDATPA